MANPFWSLSDSVCPCYQARRVGQTLRNILSPLPESTPDIAYYQNTVFLWIGHPNARTFLLKNSHFILSPVYPNDKKPAVQH